MFNGKLISQVPRNFTLSDSDQRLLANSIAKSLRRLGFPISDIPPKETPEEREARMAAQKAKRLAKSRKVAAAALKTWQRKLALAKGKVAKYEKIVKRMNARIPGGWKAVPAGQGL